jgi:hypothetical protein
MMGSVWGAMGAVLMAVGACIEVITTHLSPKFEKKVSCALSAWERAQP